MTPWWSHRRLAAIVWLSLAAPAAITWFPLSRLARPFDDGPFREVIVRGWDSWAIVSWFSFRSREWGVFLLSIVTAALVSMLLQLFLTGGVLRALLSGPTRPVLRFAVAESAGLFRPMLWTWARYLLTLVLSLALFVGGPVALLRRVGRDLAPNGPVDVVRFVWLLGGALVVFLIVSLRFNLARIALARGDADTARAAWKVARSRSRGALLQGVLLSAGWLGVAAVIQALFTNLGVAMNPRTGAGVALLVAVRQVGFYLLAMSRLGYLSSLISFESRRRPVPSPVIAPLPPTEDVFPAPPQSVPA